MKGLIVDMVTPFYVQFYLTLYVGNTNIKPGNSRIDTLRPRLELAGIDQRSTLDFAQWLNERHRSTRQGDTDLEARIASYELANRMQSAAPKPSTAVTRRKQLIGVEKAHDINDRLT